MTGKSTSVEAKDAPKIKKCRIKLTSKLLQNLITWSVEGRKQYKKGKKPKKLSTFSPKIKSDRIVKCTELLIERVRQKSIIKKMNYFIEELIEF